MAIYDFASVIRAADGVGYWALVEQYDGTLDIIDNYFETEADAERAGREFRAIMLREDAADIEERAREAGMLHGIAAYNEVKGY